MYQCKIYFNHVVHSLARKVRYHVLVKGLTQNKISNMSVTHWKYVWKVPNFRAKIYFLIMHIFLHELCSSQQKVLKKARKRKIVRNIFFVDTSLVYSTHAKRPHNSIPFPWNLLETLGLLVKFNNTYQHFLHVANMSLSFSTKFIQNHIGQCF